MENAPSPSRPIPWLADPVPGIEPVQGWTIHQHGDSFGLTAPAEYIAARGAEYRFLGVSRWNFTPTQPRWRWLVENGFPGQIARPGGASSPIDNDDIDAALAQVPA